MRGDPCIPSHSPNSLIESDAHAKSLILFEALMRYSIPYKEPACKQMEFTALSPVSTKAKSRFD
jgi:hypothetical protein